MRRWLLTSVLCAAVLAGPATAHAITRFDALDVSTLGRLQPVEGSDGRQHLVYELRLQNLSADLPLSIEAVAVRGPGDRAVETLTGEALAADMNLGDPFAIVPTTTLGPGQTGIVWMELVFATRRAVPARLRHTIRLVPGPGADAAAFATRYGRVVHAGPVPVDRRPPLVLGSPMRGTGFVAFNGCCASPGHVRTALSVGGRARVAERFAIDWMQADRQDRLWTGDGTRNDQYFVYDEPILAVADGRVVEAVDRFPDTPPLQRSTDTVSPDLAAGNHVIVDLGGGRYGLYAHIKPGTVRVRPGQRVRAGEELGRVGSSGNSDAPHLHFHLTDRPSPLAADGLPYVHRRFALEGEVRGDAITWRARPSARRDELPLDRTIVAFP